MITATLVALAVRAAPQWAAAEAPPAWEVVEGTGGYMSACALGDGFLCLTWGGGAVWLVRPGEDASVLASTETDGVERLSEPSPGGGLAGFVISGPPGRQRVHRRLFGKRGLGLGGRIGRAPGMDGRREAILDCRRLPG